MPDYGYHEYFRNILAEIETDKKTSDSCQQRIYEPIQDKEKEENRKGSITSVYEYQAVVQYQRDKLDRFGCVKVEATSFTVSEPYDIYSIEPLLYNHATAEQKQILKDHFEVFPFDIKCITTERIFVDKLFAAEFYYQRNELGDTAKHLYDLSVLSDQYPIQKLRNQMQDIYVLHRNDRLMLSDVIQTGKKIQADFALAEQLFPNQ